jgi:hypothetical protein
VHLDLLTLFGLFSVSAMLVFYALEDRNQWFILGFAGAYNRSTRASPKMAGCLM